jgi:hypothetical protein
MRRPDLLRLVQVFNAHSAPAEHPAAEVLVPASHAVLSGRFRVEWRAAGNFATVSRPNAAGDGWIAKSASANNHPDSAIIHAYAIGIQKVLPGAINVVQRIQQATSRLANAHSGQQISLEPEFTLTGAGADVRWSGARGSMRALLMPIVYRQPEPQRVEAQAMAHIESEPSTVTAYAVGTRFDEPFTADNLARYIQGLTRAEV